MSSILNNSFFAGYKPKKEEEDTDVILGRPKKSSALQNSFFNEYARDGVALDDRVADNEIGVTKSYEAIKKDPAVRNAAVRFAQDHLGYETIDPDDAISEFIEHFRSFNINELTAGMDYNIVSGLATDAASTTNKDNARKAQQRLDDYTKLYQTPHQLILVLYPASLQVLQPQH